MPEPAPDRNESADQSEASYALLDDQPVIDSSKDCLDSVNTARKLAHILRSSISARRPSPFVMAIDAPWGRGESTLLMNMYALLYIGMLLEPLLGRFRFTAAYLLSGICSSLMSITIHEYSVCVGASGAIFGLFGVFLVMLTTKHIAKPLILVDHDKE